MKKLISLALVLSLALLLLSGCAGKPATGAPQNTPDTPETPETPDTGTAVKTGLSVITDVSGSKAASAEGDGQAQASISLVAVTVDDEGVIDSCVIDMVQTEVEFSAVGLLATDPATVFLSKNELGDAYGMKKASSIGKEWNEQAAAFAAYAVGKTVEELLGIAVTEDGKAAEADLVSSVTISVADFMVGIEQAVANAAHLGAHKGDTLRLTSFTSISKSKDAAAEADGQAQTDTTVAAVTLQGETISSCAIDAVQATVRFSASGEITTDLTAPQPTKNQLGDDYGMKKASSIGKEWYEQAAAFAQYVTGKTVAQASGIAVTEEGKAADIDLVASVTIGIGDFLTLIAKAAR